MPFVVTVDSLDDYPDASPSKVDVATFAQAFHQASLRAPGAQPGTTHYITYVRPPKPSVTRVLRLDRERFDTDPSTLRLLAAQAEGVDVSRVRITSVQGVGKPLITSARHLDRWTCATTPFDTQEQAIEYALSRAQYDMTTRTSRVAVTPPNIVIDVTWDSYEITYDVEQDVSLPYIVFGA